MEEKCPKCGETLITKTIRKELGTGSIEYPVVQVCPNCHWSRDLTGAGDIVAKPLLEKKEVKLPEAKHPKKEVKPPSPPPKPLVKTAPSPAFNKMITVALAILVLGGIVWAFYTTAQEKPESTPMPTPTPEITQTPVLTATATSVAEVTPTGKSIPVFLDSRRGFIRNKEATIKAGDEIVWRNDGTAAVTLVSNDGLFDAQVLAYDKEYRYIFKKTGAYSFDLKDKNLSGTVTVEP